MVRGEVVWCSMEEAEASSDLMVARRAKAIEVVFIERTRQERELAPARPAPDVLPKSSKSIWNPPPSRGTEMPTKIDAEDLLRRLGPNLLTREQVAELIQQHFADFKGDIGALLREILAGLTLPQAAPVGTVGEKVGGDEPMFIPEQIMGDAKATITVQEEETSGDGVDAAADALRKARQGDKT